MLNLPGIKVPYLVVRGFDTSNQETVFAHQTRNMCVEKARALVNKGERYAGQDLANGSGYDGNGLLVVALDNDTDEYVHDKQASDQVWHREQHQPALAKRGRVMTQKVKNRNDVREAFRTLETYFGAMAVRERNTGVSDEEIQNLIYGTIAAFAQLPNVAIVNSAIGALTQIPGINRQMVADAVKEHFPRHSENAVPAE